MPDINGTAGNDTLNGTADADTINPLLGRDSVDGLGGSDTLIVDYSSVAVDPYAGAAVIFWASEVSSTGGSFNGVIRTVDAQDYVTFSSIEHLQVKLDFFHNTFRLDGSALAQGASLSVDGGAGTDTLDLDLSALASVNLQVAPGGITASFGTVISFEIFKLDLTEGADNVTTGSGNDTLIGNGGDDVLNSAGGQDVLSGGTGTNSLTGGDGDDRISSAGIDTVNGGDGYDRWTGDYGSSSADLIFIHNSATGTGDLSNGTTLSSIEAVDSLTTGSGNDVFTFTSEGGVSVSAGAGEDRLYLTGSGWSGIIQADGSTAFRGNLGYDQFSGIEHLNFASNDGDDLITVDAAPLLAGATLSLDGAGGQDGLTLDFTGFGGISFLVSGGTVTTSVAATLSNFETYHIISGSGADTITTGDGDDLVEARGGVDVIRTAGGNDELNGGGGADQMEGGLGNDVYVVDETADSTIEAAGAGLDTVESSASFTLAANVEQLTLTGAGAINGTGNSLANMITGNGAANILAGDLGNDSLLGAGGNDVLSGGIGNDLLDGGIDLDTMAGGAGNDTYVVDNALDKAVEIVGGGTDRVQSSVTFTLGVEVENLTLTGAAAVNGTGNILVNVLTGNAAANILNGGIGADTMQGGAGDDTYIVDNALDRAVELYLVEGIDTVQSSVAFTLTGYVENLILAGPGTINATGNAFANSLTGNVQANTLDGAAGADTMAGGLGNDTYIVDNAGDLITEAAGAGTDLVRSALSHTLSANVENLILTGATSTNGTGNGLANSITGNGGANVLDGGAGADTMNGAAGNDTYIVDDSLDRVSETSAANGTDTVQASVDFTLGANIENLILLGGSAINGTGNALANSLTGNSAVNVLNGGAGADIMRGYGGDDLYIVDNAGDVVGETPGNGTDTVRSSVGYTLAPNVENLILMGAVAINGTGNAQNNVMTGNIAANVLKGGFGNDTLDGGDGNDTLFGDGGNDLMTGGNGADRFTFQDSLGAGNADHLADFVTGSDKILLENAVFASLGVGPLNANAFVVGTTAADANDRIIYDSATGNLFYDSDGSGAGAALLFATLDNIPVTLAASDFLVI